MSRLTDPEALSLAEPGEEPWEGFEDGQVILQRACLDCDHGLLYSPARFCGRCGGNGFATRLAVRP